MAAGIYSITHRQSGRIYVGSSVDLNGRRRNHFAALAGDRHCNIKLQRAWNKYGKEAFEFAPILICSPDNLMMYEQRAIDALGAVAGGFNIAPVAGCLRGFKVVGRKMPPQSAEARRNKSIAAQTRKKTLPRPMTDEERQRRAENTRALFTGRTLTPEHRAKLAAAKRGRKLPEEHKAKIAASHKARWASKCQ